MRHISSRRAWLTDSLRNEAVGGILLLTAAATAVVMANSPLGSTYRALADLRFGPAEIGLDLSLEEWASDGLLAVFFLVAGLELKYEITRGSLRHLATAVVPVASAIGGMAVPALVYLAINVSVPGGEPRGWGIPLATDIAFALAVLAVFGRALPLPLRAFLLTLAVVDDVGAILVIALWYTESLSWAPLLAAAIACALFALAQHVRLTSWLVYVPLALAAWTCLHAAGVHPTVAGLVLGLLTRANLDPGEDYAPAERLRRVLHPWSAGICVPVFAFLAAGVTVTGLSFGSLLTGPVAIGIVVGLVVGKPIGIAGTAWLVTRLTPARLRKPIRIRDVWAIGVVAGIGFTVSLLIGQLAFADALGDLADAKVAILTASVAATALSALALASRNRHHGASSG